MLSWTRHRDILLLCKLDISSAFVTKYLLLVIVNTVSDMGNYMKYVIFFKDIVICKSKMVQKQCKILFGAPAFMDLQASVAASISVKN